MSQATNHVEAKNSDIPWFAILLLGVVLWLVFGSAPLFIHWLKIIDPAQSGYLGTIGDMFGAANALFSGLAFIAVAITLRQQQYALIQQHRESQESNAAQREMAKHQKNAISLQVILPLMDEIGSEDMRKAIIRISDFKRHHGEDGKFVEYYSSLLAKRRSNTLSEAEAQQFDEIDRARRRFVMIFHKMHRLNKSGIIGDNIVKVVIGPDDTDLLLETVEKLEAAIRANYSLEIFDFARRLYTEQERQRDGRY